MRLTSELWVSAYIRRVAHAGGQAVLARRGAREAGAIHIRIIAPEGERLLSPAPVALDAPGDAVATRRWSERAAGGAEAIDAILARETRFDEDAWVIDVEDRAGRDWLEADERGEADLD